MKLLPLLLLCPALLNADLPQLAGVDAAMQKHVDAGVISGAVTWVVTTDEIIHAAATGYANTENARPMQLDTAFDIRSMTKLTTGVAIMQLQEQGKLDLEDPVAKYLPAFAHLKTPSGRPANLNISQLLTHTSGLGEGRQTANDPAYTLNDLVRQALASPMQFEPGARWKYCQSGINTAAHIVEVVSGMNFSVYLDDKIFTPLGMSDTTHYPNAALRDRMVTLYEKDDATGKAVPQPPPADITFRHRPPVGNSRLISTANDFGRFCQMLLNEGELDGQRILQPESVKTFRTPRTTDPDAGFVPGSAWGVGAVVVTEPQGVTGMLSPGSFGHGGAFGTQAWIDPVEGVAYILMIQRKKYGNADASDVRRDFQQLAAGALRAK